MAREYIRWVPSVPVMKFIARIHTALFRLTGGLLGSRVDGLDMLLLTTRGRRSGRPRTTPLPYFGAGDDLVLVASFGGSKRDPFWLMNLRAEPKAHVRLRRRSFDVETRVAEGEERERLWRQITALHPRYLEYQERTPRRIPLLLLVGAGEGS